jgi:hypothetical protein
MREILTESQIYQGIYNTNLTEEVEIASEYFYSEGINEFGIDLLIEDLGIDSSAMDHHVINNLLMKPLLIEIKELRNVS